MLVRTSLSIVSVYSKSTVCLEFVYVPIPILLVRVVPSVVRRLLAVPIALLLYNCCCYSYTVSVATRLPSHYCQRAYPSNSWNDLVKEWFISIIQWMYTILYEFVWFFTNLYKFIWCILMLLFISICLIIFILFYAYAY